MVKTAFFGRMCIFTVLSGHWCTLTLWLLLLVANLGA